MSDKRCPNCNRSPAECASEGSQECWRARCAAAEMQLAALDVGQPAAPDVLAELGVELERFVKGDGSQFKRVFETAAAAGVVELRRAVEMVVREHQRHQEWGRKTTERLCDRFSEVLRTRVPDAASDLPEVHGFETRLLRALDDLEARLAGASEAEQLRPGWGAEERVTELAKVFSGALLDHAAEEVTATKLPLFYRIRSENLGLLLKLAQQAVSPVAVLIHCPICHTKHIDEGAFATKKHHTHACQGFVVDDMGKRRRCGHVWRPAIVTTVGVEALPGFINEEPHAER